MERVKSSLLFLWVCQSVTASPHIESIVVEGRSVNLLGDAISASEGIVGQGEIALRPLLRTGEILEWIPGMVVTQHSGTGKANQYFLRGFNLDHGTDFATFVDGMPVNMRSHGHGQGYTDLNFIIPEAVAQINYNKGAYYGEVGDFSGAGSAAITTVKALDNHQVQGTWGQDAYYRLLSLNGFRSDHGETVVALESNHYDGPWTDINEEQEKVNLLLKHTMPLQQGELSLTLMAYQNQWNSADQIPSRAVEQGLVDALGSLDDTLGGKSGRYSLSAAWHTAVWEGSVYYIDYTLDLWSNFTYFLDDATNGDQFQQVDDRRIFGGKIARAWHNDRAFHGMSNRIGIEWRMDDIDEAGLYRSQARNRLGVIRSDRIKESSMGLFWINQINLSEQLRSVWSMRYDHYYFDVEDNAGLNVNGINLDANSGHNHDGIVSLKGSLVYTLSDDWESYISAGQGFHSNDARGTTIRIDPSEGSPVDQVDPLVRSFGYEGGIRGFLNNRLNTSLALWTLELDSELLFVGDAGNTEPGRSSRRDGVELTAYYRLTSALSLDLEYAYTRAKFTDDTPEGNDIPGAVSSVFQTGLSANFGNSFFGSLRLRHFGRRPLIEDGSVESEPSTVLNLRAGYRYDQWRFQADVLNLTNSDDHDIDYYYASRLANETDGVEDIHYHIIEPRTLRLSASYEY